MMTTTLPRNTDLKRGLAAASVLVLTVFAPSAHAQHPDVGDQAPAPDTCFECHDDVKTAMAQVAHGAASASCVTCHDIAGQKNAPFLRAEPNDLCLACHHLTSTALNAPLPASIPIGRNHTVPSSLLPKKARMSLDKALLGHPVTNHPVGGVPDPLRKEKAQPLTCLSCHLPHGGATPKLLAFEITPELGVCQRCHEM